MMKHSRRGARLSPPILLVQHCSSPCVGQPDSSQGSPCCRQKQHMRPSRELNGASGGERRWFVLERPRRDTNPPNHLNTDARAELKSR